MKNKEAFVIRRNRLLPWLLGLQILPLLLAMLTMFLVPRFDEIFKDVLGDDAELPLLTRFLVDGYWLSLLVPIGLVIFSVWACLKAKSLHPAMFVVVLTIVGSLAYGLLLIMALFLPLIKLVTSLSG